MRREHVEWRIQAVMTYKTGWGWGLIVQKIVYYTKSFKLSSLEKDYMELLKVLRHEKGVIRFGVLGDTLVACGCWNEAWRSIREASLEATVVVQEKMMKVWI